MKLLVIIPTYNEIDNISKIVPEVFNVLPENAGILIVDDGSPDGTAKAVKEMQKTYSERLSLLERKEKSGLANAYITGFKWGFENGYDVLCEMDADFSHKPEYLPQLYEAIQTNDVAIGSRNIKGGAVEGWSALRNFISKGGSLYSRMVLGCPVKDLTGGFNMWRKDALEKIGLDSQGYSCHKLRHTAATLMYQHGNVDIRILKDILGHENLGTIEIYTHLNTQQMENAANANPLSKVKPKNNT